MKHYLEQILYICSIKALLMLRPVMLFDKINQLEWYRNTLRQWADNHSYHSNSRILEVGCATGRLDEYLHHNGHHVTGVDVSEGMIRHAKTRYTEVDYAVGDASKLPFKNEEFNVVLSASLINIALDRQRIFDEMQRVCKRGGWIKILVPVEGFTGENLQQLILSLNLTGFSEAALRVWHKSAPKMNYDDIDILLKNKYLKFDTTELYLNGMVLAATAMKVP